MSAAPEAVKDIAMGALVLVPLVGWVAVWVFWPIIGAVVLLAALCLWTAWIVGREVRG